MRAARRGSPGRGSRGERCPVDGVKRGARTGPHRARRRRRAWLRSRMFTDTVEISFIKTHHAPPHARSDVRPCVSVPQFECHSSVRARCRWARGKVESAQSTCVVWSRAPLVSNAFMREHMPLPGAWPWQPLQRSSHRSAAAGRECRRERFCATPAAAG